MIGTLCTTGVGTGTGVLIGTLLMIGF